MKSELAVRLIPVLLQEFELINGEQTMLNKNYDAFADFVLKEAEQSMEKTGRWRPVTRYKPYWDTELSVKWKLMHKAEAIHSHSCKDDSRFVSEQKRKDFKSKQKTFDKTLKKKKVAHSRGSLLEIEQCNVNNPTAFWEHIKKLGPSPKRSEIPWEIEVDGQVRTDPELVLNKWKEAFESLYNIDSGTNNEDFLSGKMERLNELMKANMEQFPDDTIHLNRPLELSEIKKAIDKSKLKKAVGVDRISNELLKNTEVINLLYKLLSSCFLTQKIPNQWQHAMIHPIPKEKGRCIDPLKYRGLALQSCVYKIYSNVLNERIVEFMEKRSIICDEQNGFRKGRLCSHHVFTLMTLV